MQFLSKKKTARKGQGLVEYIILIGLVAMVVFAIVKTFGSDLKTQFTNANKTVSGISDASGS